MPRDGSLVLSDVRGPTLTIVCAACGPRGRYNIEGLMTEHGDAKVCDVGYSRLSGADGSHAIGIITYTCKMHDDRLRKTV